MQCPGNKVLISCFFAPWSLLTSALPLTPSCLGNLPAEDPHHCPVFCLHVGSQAWSLSVALTHHFDDWSSSCAGKCTKIILHCPSGCVVAVALTLCVCVLSKGLFFYLWGHNKEAFPIKSRTNVGQRTSLTRAMSQCLSTLPCSALCTLFTYLRSAWISTGSVVS